MYYKNSIELKNISKTFDNIKYVLSDISLEIQPGKFFVLLGPSGCGKSTLLRIIAGLEEPNTGEIFINDRYVNNLAPGKRNISMVFQNYALFPHMSVRENIAYGMKVRGIKKHKREARINEISNMLGIQELLNRKPKELSGGQKQRVALGRAIVREPDVFLFDEPLSNLDAKLRSEIRNDLKELHNRMKYTFIYVTHDQVEAMTLGDRICVLNDGIIQQLDTPLNVYNKPNNTFVAAFLGNPRINLIKIENGYMGIRPHYLNLDNRDNLSSKIEGKYQYKETLGDIIYIHFTINGNKLIGTASNDYELNINDSVTFFYDQNHAIYFDSKKNLIK
jgi:ABC-type sugar transport system ATPase subunit